MICILFDLFSSKTVDYFTLFKIIFSLFSSTIRVKIKLIYNYLGKNVFSKFLSPHKEIDNNFNNMMLLLTILQEKTEKLFFRNITSLANILCRINLTVAKLEASVTKHGFYNLYVNKVVKIFVFSVLLLEMQNDFTYDKICFTLICTHSLLIFAEVHSDIFWHFSVSLILIFTSNNSGN